MIDLDKLFAEKVMGWKQGVDFSILPGIGTKDHILIGINIIWHPRTNIAQAFELIDKLIDDGWDHVSLSRCGTKWFLALGGQFKTFFEGPLADTREEAISLAVLKAVDSQ